MTVIKYDGKEMVRQRRHCDGEPEYIIPEIIRFLQDASALEHLRRNLLKCEFAEEEEHLVSEHAWDLLHPVGGSVRHGFMSFNERIEDLRFHARRHNLNDEDVLRYYLYYRVTGVNILDLLAHEISDKASRIYPVKFDYDTDFDEKDNRFYATYVIDLYHETVTCYCKRCKAEVLSFNFSNLPSKEMVDDFCVRKPDRE
jgi:hypothetical protein